MYNLSAQKINSKITGHSIGWLFFICYDTGMLYFNLGTTGPVANMVFFYTCNILIFYTHYFVLSSTLGRDQPMYIRLCILTVIVLLTFTLFKCCWEIVSDPINDALSTGFPFLRHAFVNNLARSIYYAGIATMVWSAGHVAGYRKKAVDAEISRLTLERDNAKLSATLASSRNAYLKQQLNPHLLFNTLGFIYSSVQQYSDEGADVVQAF